MKDEEIKVLKAEIEKLTKENELLKERIQEGSQKKVNRLQNVIE